MEHRVGEPVAFSGYASDYDRKVTAVQFSLDNERTWTTFPVDATSDRWVRWKFVYTPKRPGVYLLKVRAVSEAGQVSKMPADVQFTVV